MLAQILSHGDANTVTYNLVIMQYHNDFSKLTCEPEEG